MFLFGGGNNTSNNNYNNNSQNVNNGDSLGKSLRNRIVK